MTTITTFIAKRPLLSYYVLTFAISWGGFVVAVGPGGFGSSNWEGEGTFLAAVMAMLAGPTIAGLLLTSVLDGRAGLRDLISRLLRWRVGARWYVIALVPAPLLSGAVLVALSLTSPVFTAAERTAVIVAGIMAGLTTLFEEIGWTGFAIPRLRQRHGIFVTGLIAGLLWGAWHLLQQIYIGGTYAAGIPTGFYVLLSFVSAVVGLTAYRVLMVWVYDRTASLLVATLMHGSLTASNVFIFRPDATGLSFLLYGWIFNAALWIVVAVVALSGRGQLSRQPLPKAA